MPPDPIPADAPAVTGHTVSRLSFDGSGRYRLEPTRSPELAEGSSRPSGVTAVGDGRRHWNIIGDEWRASADGLPPDGLATVLDPSRLLEHRLSFGAETTVGGRRGYRLRVAPDGPATPGMIFADDVVVVVVVVADAELGILLRVIWHTGSGLELWFELRDVVAGGDIRIDIPEEARTAFDDLHAPGVSPGRRLANMLAREAAREARSAFKNVFGGEIFYGSSPYRSCHRRRRNASLLPSSYWTALASSSSGSRLGSASASRSSSLNTRICSSSGAADRARSLNSG
jgi:hypothetical protein